VSFLLSTGFEIDYRDRSVVFQYHEVQYTYEGKVRMLDPDLGQRSARTKKVEKRRVECTDRTDRKDTVSAGTTVLTRSTDSVRQARLCRARFQH